MATDVKFPPASQVPREEPRAPAAPARRYVALDAARGFVMMYLCTEGFGLSYLKGGPTATRVASWFTHLDWAGFRPWELVYPAFMFMVGAALPFALARRQAQGKTFGQNLRHVIFRACILALFGAILYSLSAKHYHADPIETLTQIGISYLFAFLILQMEFKWQVVAAAGLMAFNWGLFALFPGTTGACSKHQERRQRASQRCESGVAEQASVSQTGRPGRKGPRGQAIISSASPMVTVPWWQWVRPVPSSPLQTERIGRP